MSERIIQCPICHIDMQKRSVQNELEIDYCDEHGVWLDAGELEVLEKGAEPPKESTGKKIGKKLGDYALFGFGATAGSRLCDAVINAVFRR